DLDGDDIVAQRAQRLVAHPAPAARIGDQDAAALARRRDQPPHQLPAFGTAQITGDRALSAIEPRPVDALARLGHRPAVLVARPADRVDADDLRAELGEGQAAQ